MNRYHGGRFAALVAAVLTLVALAAGSAQAQVGPVVWQQPAPVVVSQKPAVVVPTPVTRFYRPPIVTYQPVIRTYTRRRPILGGTVTRNRYGYQRVVF
jgi:hypothetical protein